MKISKEVIFLALKIVYVIANSLDPEGNAVMCSISSGSSLFSIVLIQQSQKKDCGLISMSLICLC